MSARPDDLAPLVPLRTIESEQSEDGKVTITESRQEETWFAKLLSKGLEPGHNHIKLDEVGSLVWAMCDGGHTVREIAEAIAERFGDGFDPDSKRLAIFLLTMKQRGWLVWKPGEPDAG
jgi:hypothetical protein